MSDNNLTRTSLGLPF